MFASLFSLFPPFPPSFPFAFPSLSASALRLLVLLLGSGSCSVSSLLWGSGSAFPNGQCSHVFLAVSSLGLTICPACLILELFAAVSCPLSARLLLCTVRNRLTRVWNMAGGSQLLGSLARFKRSFFQAWERHRELNAKARHCIGHYNGQAPNAGLYLIGLPATTLMLPIPQSPPLYEPSSPPHGEHAGGRLALLPWERRTGWTAAVACQARRGSAEHSRPAHL